MEYDHISVEGKWSKKWSETGIYNTPDSVKGKENLYILSEFIYPSGNLHVGHWYAFGPLDILVRFKRMSGFNVLFPMGMDSFGLPAENAAIARNTDPRTWTYGNIDSMHKQLNSTGASFDWSREVITSDPNYYKWTQWIFIQLFKKGLAYRKDGPVNWCPSCKTVLANEQVTEGECERCSAVVENKKLQQWFFKITHYADRLIDDLDTLEWPNQIKQQQKNWIGRSYGASFEFTIQRNNGEHSNQKIEVFTTRPDTLYGVTFFSLSPQHKLIDILMSFAVNTDEVMEYVKQTQKKTNNSRTIAADKEKTGVVLENVFVINPITQKSVPVYVSDYVLMEYGTGAVMGVPAHDERDYQFAVKYGIPIIEVIKKPDNFEGMYTGHGEMINSEEFNGMLSSDIADKIIEKGNGSKTKNYKLRDWSVSRQRYWGCPIPIVYDPDGNAHPVPEQNLPWLLPDDADYRPTGEAPLLTSKELKERTEKTFGVGWTPECETLDTFVDSSWYFLRYLSPHNDEEFVDSKKMSTWMPVHWYFGGAEHTTLHVLYSRFFYKALSDLGLVKGTEPYKHRINRGNILGLDKKKMSKSKGNVLDPDEQVKKYGADTVRAYLAFLGPYGITVDYAWNESDLIGIRRFVERVFSLKDFVSPEAKKDDLLLNQTIFGVGKDIENFKFNTAISKLMIFTNSKLSEKKISPHDYEVFLKLISPFCPFISEEMWSMLGKSDSVHQQSWPEYDATNIQSSVVSIAVQINGKTKKIIEVARDSDQSFVFARAQEIPHIKDYLDNNKTKVIFVADKILNICST